MMGPKDVDVCVDIDERNRLGKITVTWTGPYSGIWLPCNLYTRRVLADYSMPCHVRLHPVQCEPDWNVASNQDMNTLHPRNPK
jgi:hypothetical protein